MGATRIAAATLLALLAGAAPAAAAPGFLGTGHDPGVAVDRAGTAHVAWLAEPAEDQNTLEYCQVPRGKRQCAVRRTLPVERFGSGKVQVLVPRAGTVHIVAPLVNADSVLFSSADGGSTFAAVSLGETPGIERAVFGPGETISLVSGTGPVSFGRFGLDGSGGRKLPVEFGSATEGLDTALAPFGPGFAVFFSGLAGRSVLWNGLGDPNLQQSWSEGPRLGSGRTTVTAVGGRSGTYVAYVDRRGPRSDTFVRRLRGTRLRRAVRVSRQDPAELSFAQGPRGDMALLWQTSDDAYFVRSRTGRRWTRTRRLLRGNEPGDLRAALGRRGGWVVWDGSPGNTGSNPIRIAAIPRAPRR